MNEPENHDADSKLADLLEAVRSGKFTLDAIAREQPDLADEVRALLDTAQQLDTSVSEWRWLASRPPLLAPTQSLDGAVPSQPRPLDCKTIGRYRVLGQLGAGGMGTVFRGHDPLLDRAVAIKVPHGEQERYLARFAREAVAAARVQHPHICPIHDVGEDQGRPFLVMAFVEGGSLADRLTREKTLPSAVAVRLTRQIAEALGALHARGLVHRDLKPGNVLLDEQGRALVTDFGLARPDEEAARLTLPGSVLGTPAYMAPEQARGDLARIGPPADLYSLGVILYEMLTGRLPFEGPPLAVLSRLQTEAPTPPGTWRPDLDPRLQQVVLRLLAKRPEDRYPDAAALLRDLEAFETGLPITTPELPAAGSRPATVKVEMPDGTPLTVSVDVPAGAKGMAVQVREKKSKKRGKQLAVLVTFTLSLVLISAIGLVRPGMPGVPAPGGRFAPMSTPAPLPEGRVEILLSQDLKVEAEARARQEQAQLALEKKLAKLDKMPSLLPKITRVRRPRVEFALPVEAAGAMDRYVAPFVIAVVADLAGQPVKARLPLGKRRMLNIDRDSFFDVMQRLAPRHVSATGKEFVFRTMEDFDQAAADPVTGKDVAFLRLESAWRGLRFLVNNSETGHSLRIHVLDASQGELVADLTAGNVTTRSALFAKLAEEFRQPGGTPTGVLLVDQTFGQTREEVALLRGLGELGQMFAMPVIAGAKVPDLVRPPESDLWKEFREMPVSQWLALTLPRVSAGRHGGWMNAAWVLGVDICDAQAKDGWPARLAEMEGKEGIEGLHPRTLPGGTSSCLERDFSPVEELTLTRAGYLPAVYRARNRRVAFVTAHTVRSLPGTEWAGRLSVLLCSSRVAQSLALLARDRLLMDQPPAEVEKSLQNWLGKLVASGGEKDNQASQPLSFASIQLRAAAGKPWEREIKCLLRPAFQIALPPEASVVLVLPIWSRK